MTRGTIGCCACGSLEHDSYACPQPKGQEYVPPPTGKAIDPDDTWTADMLLMHETDPCSTPTPPRP